MSKIDDGGPAFPHPNGDYAPDHPRHVVRRAFGGMSLRDWFAGQALNAMVSTPIETSAAAQNAGMSRTAYVTQCAYELADAMIATRTRSETDNG